MFSLNGLGENSFVHITAACVFHSKDTQLFRNERSGVCQGRGYRYGSQDSVLSVGIVKHSPPDWCLQAIFTNGVYSDETSLAIVVSPSYSKWGVNGIHTKAVKGNKASSKGLQLLRFPSFWRCICIKSPDAGFNNVSGFFLLKWSDYVNPNSKTKRHFLLSNYILSS